MRLLAGACIASCAQMTDFVTVWGPFAVLATGCAIGGCVDIWRRRIPNLLCLALVAAGFAYAIGLAPSGAWPWHVAFCLTSLVVGAVLFRLGWFGAGDAKFLAAVSMWFPLQQAPKLLGAIGLSGLVVLVAWFTYRRLMGKKISRPKDSPFEQLPYGVAIALGAIAAAIPA